MKRRCVVAGALLQEGLVHFTKSMTKENYVNILKQHLISQEVKTLFSNGFSKWTVTPGILPRLWQNGLRRTKSRYWTSHHKAPTSIQYNIHCQNWKSTSELWTWLGCTSERSLCYLKRLTQIKHFKGNATKYWCVMRERKADINHSVSCYSALRPCLPGLNVRNCENWV